MAKLLPDTTYLPPVLSVAVNLERYGKVFPKLLERYTVFYNPISLVESKWIMLRLCRRDPGKKRGYLEAYKRGLKALLNDNRIQQIQLTNPEVEEVADKLLVEAGVKDYFDRLIYATATYLKTTLLTEECRVN